MDEVVSIGRQLYLRMIEGINRYGQILQLILAALVSLLCFLWTYKSIGIVYIINDDVALQEIAKGSFSGLPDGHLIYIKYTLGWIISRLYLIDQNINWYGLTMLGLMYICLLLILFRALEVTKTFRQKIKVILLVLAGYTLFGLQQFSEFQYTIVAGLLAATSIFWLYTMDSPTNYRRFVDCAIFVLLMITSYMVRSNVFFMSLPFAGITFLYKNFDWGSRRIHQAMLPILILVGIGVVFLIEQNAYSAPEWKAYLKFNELRTQIYDFYTLPDYSEYQEFYRSISVNKETYNLLLNFTFVPNLSANSQTFQAIFEKCKAIADAKLASTPFFSVVNDMVKKIFDTMVESRYALINITCVVLFSFLLARKKATFSYMDAFFFLSFVTIHFTEWLYLIFRNRYPAHVIWVIYLLELLLLIAVFLKDSEPLILAKKKGYKLTVYLLGILITIAVANYHIQDVKEAVHSIVNINNNCQKVMAYVADHPNNFYLLPTYPFSVCTETFAFQAKNNISNYSFMGGWEFFSPPLINKFENHGFTDFQQDPIKRNNILFIIKPSDSTESIVEYYRSNNLNVVPKEVDTIDIVDYSNLITVIKLEIVQELVH
jgi:hypothetical protein